LTFIAALCLVIPHLYTWIKYGSSFEGEVHEIDALIVAFGLFWYMVSYFLRIEPRQFRW